MAMFKLVFVPPPNQVRSPHLSSLCMGMKALEVSTEQHLHPQQSRGIIWAVLTGTALPSPGAAGQWEPAIARESCC